MIDANKILASLIENGYGDLEVTDAATLVEGQLFVYEDDDGDRNLYRFKEHGKVIRVQKLDGGYSVPAFSCVKLLNKDNRLVPKAMLIPYPTKEMIEFNIVKFFKV